MKTTGNPRNYGVFYAPATIFFLAFAAVLLIQSCDEHDEVGMDLYKMDGRYEVRMESLDTLTLKAITSFDDSVGMNLGSSNILGIIDDPVFGKTRASIYTETRLSTNNLSLGESPVLDSVHLVLAYTGHHYGQVETFQTIRVYELSENFPDKDTLYSNLVIPHHPGGITRNPAGHYFRPAPKDSVMVDTIIQPPQIRIPLADAFGQKLVDASGTETFENVSNYLDKFKGLYITIDDELDGKGSKYRINMLAHMSAIELYYHNEGEEHQRIQRFLINEFCKRSTRVEHFGYDHVHEILRSQVKEGDQEATDSLLFVHSLGLLRANIHIPHLEDVSDIPRMLINKAELVVPVAEEFITEEFPAPENLLLLRIRDDGNLGYLEDYMIGSDYFGGRFDEGKMQYTFNISQYLQFVLQGDYPNDGLALLVAGASVDMSRVVLHGPGRTKEPVRLKIYYSVFD